MEKVLKTKLLEFDKSGFLIDIIKNRKGAKYIKIEQIIHDTKERQSIRINPAVLSDIIEVLNSYRKEIDNKPLKPYEKKSETTTGFIASEQNEIVKRYLKGVPIRDLGLQFSCSPKHIEQILFNKNIEIVDTKEELAKLGRVNNRFWKRRKR